MAVSEENINIQVCRLGYKARLEGKLLSDNPYNEVTEEVNFVSWAKGFSNTNQQNHNAYN